jgi:large subunit ribosomal protein L4
MKVNTYTNIGKKAEATQLPDGFMADENMALLTQAIRVFENRKHPGISRTKTRSEVKTSTRKIYKQKGTGGARHGAKSAPIFVGGGTAHGPSGNKRVLDLPAKMRAKALQIALGVKVSEGMVVVVDGLSKIEKAGDAKEMLSRIAKEEKYTTKRFTVVLSEGNVGTLRYLRNLRNVETVQYRSLNAYAVFFGGILVVDAEAFAEGGKTEKAPSSAKATAGKKEKVEKKVVVKKSVKKVNVKK